MSSINQIVRNVQSLLRTWSPEAGREYRVVLRQRKFTLPTLAATFIFGFLRNPRASDAQLAQMAAAVAVEVSPQAVSQRYTPQLGLFLKSLFRHAVRQRVAADEALAPLLEMFSDVLILDSTTISLPDELADEYPGCGAVNHKGRAAMKLQVRLSLKTGALDAVGIEGGRDCDLKTPLQNDVLPTNSLRIADLGYFDTRVLEQLEKQQAYWLSPLAYGTNVYHTKGQVLELLSWLRQAGPVIDDLVKVGAERQVPCRLIAWRLPEEVANRRREKVRKEAKRKSRTPTQERLQRCDWAILVTNVPAEKLSIDEARVLYRSRWQVELLFKRWKSQGLVDELGESSITRQIVKLWARLLAAVLQQWLQVGLWGTAQISLKKSWDALASFAMQLACVAFAPERLKRTIQQIYDIITRSVRQNKRKKASTFELLNDPSKLPYALT